MQGWDIEADPRHMELAFEQLGMSNEKPVTTPGVSGAEEDYMPECEPLKGQDVSA